MLRQFGYDTFAGFPRRKAFANHNNFGNAVCRNRLTKRRVFRLLSFEIGLACRILFLGGDAAREVHP
jgi:hypothetical protein